MSNASAPGGVVVVLANKAGGKECAHERQARETLAQRIAALKGYTYAGHHDRDGKYAGHVYFVPGDTLTSVHDAHRIGVHGEHDLFGGVVPHPHVATKTITHPLAGNDAVAPAGWSSRFADAVAGVVLPGFSAFALADARLAGAALLQQGAVRIKKADGIGGAGQSVARDDDQLEQQLQEIDAAAGFAGGVVLERNLTEVSTLSVGQVRLGEYLATYYGRQRLTRNNLGEEVYGGSDLVVVRGGHDALLRLDLAPEVRLAVEQANVYHAAALACYPGMFVSRSNYDIAQGRDCRGEWRSGVLEQSWRAGGASGAEIAALEAFCREPGLRAARASTVEVYGDGEAPPKDAVIYFRGHDAAVGHITKYARLEPHAHT
ncbi:MAG TPA: DUF3182 family protein [Noviherbaspirillum sp.]|uniref:DUF3182 family protein n=1 Tax=Noviherbaspirillum sp. TaxID=1926288 RepID=UPI002F9470C1